MRTNYTLREVFKAGFEAYRRIGGMLPFQLKAGLAILRCRTAELGGHAKQKRGLAVVEVRDNGPGIPREIRENLLKKPIKKAGSESRLGFGLLLARDRRWRHS